MEQEGTKLDSGRARSNKWYCSVSSSLLTHNTPLHALIPRENQTTSPANGPQGSTEVLGDVGCGSNQNRSRQSLGPCVTLALPKIKITKSCSVLTLKLGVENSV